MSIHNQKWICGGNCDAPLIEKNVTLPKIENAQIDVCVLGFFEMYINNEKVSNDVLNPVCSQFEKDPGKDLLYPINDTFTSSRAYYVSYDITNYLNEGENNIAFYLGNGWYNQKDRTIEGKFAHGVPRMCFEINIKNADGTQTQIVSDNTFVYRPSFITYNNIFCGEKHDYSLASQPLKNVNYCTGTTSELVLQTCPPDRIIRTVTPTLIATIGTKKIYDCGENITGWVSFKSEKHTDKVVIKFAEEITSDKRLDYDSTGVKYTPEQLQKDEFILDGTERICRPKFTWHGFRYFEFDGCASEITVQVIYSDVASKAEFNCSDELLNKLFDATRRSLLTNMHCGVISDCPHRERLGYTGDAQNTADIAMFMLEADKFYEKFIADIADTQDVNNGHIQHTAPFFGGGGGPGGWGCAIVVIPYAHYKNYGDTKILKQYYPNMLKYISYMQSRCTNDLVSFEEEGGWCLGEWGTETDVQIPEKFVNTYFLVKSLITVKEIASVLGEPNDNFDKYIKIYKNAIRTNFYNSTKNTYCDGVNAADAFAADIGLADEACINNLNKKYQSQKFDTGIFGTALLLDVLFKNNFADTAFKLLTEKGENTFYQHHIEFGATTLWENWCGESHNHHMFGAIVTSFFRHILGMNIGKDIVIEPKTIQALDYASGNVKTVFGDVFVSYKKAENSIKFDIYCDKDATFKYNSTSYPIYANRHNIFEF